MTDVSLPVVGAIAVVATAPAISVLIRARRRLIPRDLPFRPLVRQRRHRRSVATLPIGLSRWEALVLSSRTHPRQFERRLLPRLAELATPEARSAEPTWARLAEAAAAGRVLELSDLSAWLDTLDEVDQ